MHDFRFLLRSQLDTHAWDHCILNAPNGLPYAHSWYLDIVCNNQWAALVTGDYKAVMPLAYNRKIFGYQQLYQPILTQQLGVFGDFESDELAQMFHYAQKHFRRINFNISANNYQQIATDNSKIVARTNLLLPLNQPYEAIHDKYAKSLKKRLRQSRSLLLCKSSKRIDTLIATYREQVGDRLQWPEHNYQLVAQIIEVALSKSAGILQEVIDQEGALHAIGFFLVGNGRVINLFGASTTIGRKHHAMHFLIDNLIQSYLNKADYFDFEGSEIPGVAAFFRSFGAIEESYAQYSCNTLPVWANMLLNIKKAIR